jgi:hypothetical protein
MGWKEGEKMNSRGRKKLGNNIAYRRGEETGRLCKIYWKRM